MKKTTAIFLSIVSAGLLLTSCVDSPTHEDWQKHHDRECASHITKFNYEGHQYLLYEYGTHTAVSVSICHDENCHCKKGGRNESN